MRAFAPGNQTIFANVDIELFHSVTNNSSVVHLMENATF